MYRTILDAYLVRWRLRFFACARVPHKIFIDIGSPIAKIHLRHRGWRGCCRDPDKGKGISPDKLNEMTSSGMPGVGFEECGKGLGSLEETCRLTPRLGRGCSSGLPAEEVPALQFRCFTGCRRVLDSGRLNPPRQRQDSGICTGNVSEMVPEAKSPS